MPQKCYVGVDGKARNVPKIYVGVGGVARKVTKGYIGVNGVAKLFFESIPPLLVLFGSINPVNDTNTLTIDNVGFTPVKAVIYAVSVNSSQTNVSFTFLTPEGGWGENGYKSSSAAPITYGNDSVTFSTGYRYDYYNHRITYKYIIWGDGV